MERSDYVKAWNCLNVALENIQNAMAFLGDEPSEQEREHAALDVIQSIVEEEGLGREWHEAIAERRADIERKAS